MHEIKMPAWATERVLARRGKAHIHDDLDPKKTALIVVDLQTGFMVEDVAVAYVPIAVEVIPNVNRLAAAVRESGGKVFWIKNTVDPANVESWSNWYAMARPDPTMDEKRIRNFEIDGPGHAIHPQLKVLPEDEIVLKYRFSAFIQGSSDLPTILREQGYDTVLITGTVTNVCCESSARDAMMLNFKTIMVADGNAARTDEEHNATLANFYVTFGDVMDTDMLVDVLQKSAMVYRDAAE